MIDDFADIPIQGFAPDGTVVYWNKAIAEMYGYTGKEMILKEVHHRIKNNMNIVDAQIDSKKLQTISMMVNELMSNVYKYVFPLGAEGKVSISMTFPQPDLWLLEHRDTVKGLPESILNDSSDDGFGMMLIRMLIEQLGATSEIRNDHGACFSFRIPI